MRTYRFLAGIGFCLALVASSSLRGAEPPSTPGQVHAIKVLPDRAPDCSSLAAIVKSVTRGCKTNDEKAIAIYNFMQLAHYHQGYPGEPDGLGTLKEINVYGWSLCGGLHTVEAALWREMGWPWRYVGWSDPGHTTAEVQYDGRWHYFDSFLKLYVWMPDANAPGGRTVAGELDIKANPDLITKGLELDKARNVYYHKGNRFENIDERANWRAPSFLCCGDEPAGILTGVRSSKQAGNGTGWGSIQFDSPGYSTDVNLAPGAALTLTWDPIKGAHWWGGRKYVPSHGCGDKDYRNCPAIGPIMEPYHDLPGRGRSWANGTLLFAADFKSDAFLAGLASRENVKLEDGKLVPAEPGEPASIVVPLQSPYIMTRASGKAEGVDAAALSVDGGKTYKAIRLEDFSEEVGGKYSCLVKLSFKKPLASLRLEAIVQCNRGALPYLSPGKNHIAVSVADPRQLGDNRLAITYAYEEGSRDRSYEQLADLGAELGRAHFASWSKKPTVVQKIFTAKDLPAVFDIDIPTPAGKHPVYPRMLFIRREVLAPGTQPLPLPEGAHAPRKCRPEELKTLPNPFTVGITPAPPRVVRPTSKKTISLPTTQTVSLDGQVQKNHYLKWKKGETWVLLVGGDLGDLPPARDIAAARLVFPVSRGHAQAATKVAACLLGTPFEEGKPYDFKNLGDPASTAVVPRQPGDAEYSPPRTFALDVTPAIKQIAAGEARFRGFALRVVPDRSVDDGYIGRVDVPSMASLRLDLEVYERK